MSLAIKATLKVSVLGRTFGLLGKKAEPILLKTRFGIHTFGLKFPIDVLVLDTRNQNSTSDLPRLASGKAGVERVETNCISCVVAMKENLQPNRVFFWNPKYNQVLELPSGFIKSKEIIIGTKINILSL